MSFTDFDKIENLDSGSETMALEFDIFNKHREFGELYFHLLSSGSPKQLNKLLKYYYKDATISNSLIGEMNLLEFFSVLYLFFKNIKNFNFDYEHILSTTEKVKMNTTISYLTLDNREVQFQFETILYFKDNKIYKQEDIFIPEEFITQHYKKGKSKIRFPFHNHRFAKKIRKKIQNIINN